MKKSILTILISGSLLFYGCSKSDVMNGSTNTNLNDKPTGSSANDFLSAVNYQSIQMEIVYMPGYEPDAAALNNLLTFLNTVVNKPGGIQVSKREIPASGKTTLTITDVANIEKNTRTVFNSGTTLGVYLLFADAEYSQQGVLGTAYKNTSLAVYGKKVHDNSGGVNQASLTKLESTVTEHEFGHLLGLVDLGSPMQAGHIDAAHGNHCANTACLMYYATQVNMMGGILISGPVPTLDNDCRNDLYANGGK